MTRHQHAGLTPELHSRLVSEHAALKQVHKKVLISSISKKCVSAVRHKLASFTKRLIVQSWNVLGYRPELSIG